VKKHGDFWQHSTVDRMLRNEFYAGIYRYGKRNWIKTNPNTGEGYWVTNDPENVQTVMLPEHMAIVGVPKFQAVQKRLEKSKQLFYDNQTGARFLLSGIFKCGKCGHAMAGRYDAPYRTYGCGAMPYIECPNKKNSLNADDVEGSVWNALQQALMHDDHLEKLIRKHHAGTSGERARIEQRLEVIQQLIDKHQSSIVGLTSDLRELGDVSGEARNIIRREIDALSRSIEDLKTESGGLIYQLYPLSEDFEIEIKEYVERILGNLENPVSWEWKRQVLEAFDVEVVWHGEKNLETIITLFKGTYGVPLRNS
jgi:hypothetical protein